VRCHPRASAPGRRRSPGADRMWRRFPTTSPAPPHCVAACPPFLYSPTASIKGAAIAAAPLSSVSSGPCLTPGLLPDAPGRHYRRRRRRRSSPSPKHHRRSCPHNPSLSTHHWGEDLVAPPSPTTSPRCSSRGGEDLVNREAAGEPHGARHRAAVHVATTW
jgi:hypothetical protein